MTFALRACTPALCPPAGLLPSSLSYAQAAILLKLGLQRKDLSDVEAELSLPSSQVCVRVSVCVRNVLNMLRHVSKMHAYRVLSMPLGLSFCRISVCVGIFL
jgi:tRNA(Met) C34 N-acetyltransferase TmcA